MYGKIKAASATILGGLLIAGTAAAQTANTPDTTGTTTTTTTTTPSRAQPMPDDNQQGPTAQTTGTTSCPAGCVRAPTQADMERAAARRRARADRLRMEQEQRDQVIAAAAERARELENCQNDLSQRTASLTEAQQRQRDLEAQNAQLAARQRELEEQARLAAMRTQTVVTPARGGGPVETMVARPYMPRGHIGIEGGVAGYGGDANLDFNVGGTWGARIGLDFFRWLSIEGRYFGAAIPGRENVLPGVTSVVNGGSGVLVLGIPIQLARIYAFGGVGGYHFDQNLSTAQTPSPLRVVNTLAVPVGGGLDFMVGNHFSIGAEGTYHWLERGEDFSANTLATNPQLWTASAVFNFHL